MPSYVGDHPTKKKVLYVYSIYLYEEKIMEFSLIISLPLSLNFEPNFYHEFFETLSSSSFKYLDKITEKY